jgi:pimeloyl-ACP methyl ester carboxylesterase
MFKRILQVLGIFLVLVIVIPFIGPWLGLADYRSMAPEPGQRVNLSNGDHVNFYREGSGKPVVLIHGRPGTGRMMLPLARALARLGYSAITYDRIGYGHSSRRSSEVPANPTENARDLLRLIEALGLDDPSIVAYSYGGGVALEAARLDPNAFSRLTLIAPALGLGDNSERIAPPTGVARIFFSVPVMRWMMGTEFIAMRMGKSGIAAMFYPAPADDIFHKQYFAGLSMPGVPGTFIRERMERYHGFDGYRPDATMACALIIQGVDDKIVPAEGATVLRNAISGSELRLLNDTGHAVVIQQPDRLAELIASHDEACSN